MNTRLKYFLIMLLALAAGRISAQAQKAIIQGRVTDDQQEPLAGVNIYLDGTVLGSASDDAGNFVIRNVPFGTYRLKLTMVGYAASDTLIKIDRHEIEAGTIILNPVALQASPIVVTAGRYEQDIRDIPMSISTVSAREIEYRNSVTIDDALRYVSGVNMNSDQVNIRGSNGYSYGVGSRVMMLVDGIPYITGDTQGLIFTSIPMDQIERLEILKGAGSAMYGSNALGGVINIITKPITENPSLSLKLYGGLYAKPYYDEWDWSDKNRFTNGIRAGYSRKFGSTGVRLDLSRDEDDSYRKNDWSARYNAGGKIDFDLSAFDRLTLNGNYLETHRENFLYWKDLSHALEPPDDQLGDRVHTRRYYVSGIYRRIFGEREFLKADAIWYKNRFDDDVSLEGNHSNSDFMYTEMQYNRQFGKHYLVAGITPSYSGVRSNLFGDRQGYTFAAYLQDEIKIAEDLTGTAGARLDYFDIDELGSDQRVSPKIGLVYKPDEGTVLRLSSGTGFRAPSMAEAFTSTTAGGLVIEPNPDLKPEYSFSVEVGWNQTFSEALYTQLSCFYNYYRDLIEGGFQTNGNIRFENITEARITGFEYNLNWQVFSGVLWLNAGYTFVNARDAVTGDYLKYRPRHLLYLNSNQAWLGFETGVDYRFISRFDAIDETFALIIPDAEERVADHMVDVRISRLIDFDLMPLKISLQINNLLQYNYVDVIGSIAPIRNYVLSLESTF
jgi:outer membrane receptor for ferrienterochelin and colicins